MLRTAISAFRVIRPISLPCSNAARIICHDIKNYSSRNITLPTTSYTPTIIKGTLLFDKQILNVANNISNIPSRTVTKFSLKKGKRKTVKAVVKRFFRLHWGVWIRPKIGRHKRLWKKSAAQKRRLKNHLFCNSTQTTLLDKMVTKFWKRPKYYVDDPYAPYHTREEYYITRKKPVVRD